MPMVPLTWGIVMMIFLPFPHIPTFVNIRQLNRKGQRQCFGHTLVLWGVFTLRLPTYLRILYCHFEPHCYTSLSDRGRSSPHHRARQQMSLVNLLALHVGSLALGLAQSAIQLSQVLQVVYLD